MINPAFQHYFAKGYIDTLELQTNTDGTIMLETASKNRILMPSY